MTAMAWQTTGDVAAFLAAAGEYLRAERARNTVLLTVTETMRLNRDRYPAVGGADPDGRPLFGWWTAKAGAVAGAFLHTPPYPVLLSAVTDAAAAELAAGTLAGRELDGINAYPEAARAFAAAWRASTGRRAQVRLRSRLYRLAGLAWPDPLPPGAARVATAADTGLLVDWFAAFGREAGHGGAEEDGPATVRDQLGYGGITVWEAGGEPVSMAGNTRQVAGMVRVGPVYTPPDKRAFGYGSAVTAAVSERAMEAGAEEVLLYTDLANPVSNSIYQRIGYRPVEDRLTLAFTGA